LAGHANAIDELELVIKSGCIACHGISETSVGPRYTDVAKKYGGLETAEETLAGHIVKGTGPTGVGWMKEGKASMPFMYPSRFVSVDDAHRMARWILSTKGEMPGLARYVSKRFSVSGAVKTSFDLGVDELRKLPAQDLREIDVVMEALATPHKTEHLKGVPLRTLLERAVIQSPDHDMRKIIIVAKSSNSQLAIFAWADIFSSPISDGVLVYFERDGKALADDEGKIALISGKDTHLSCRHVRWLKSIEVRYVAK
jgi:cytochrome c551/c552